jgi:hypothetical protein
MPLVIIKSDKRAREKPCLRCGYSLRKLLDAKRCPECGLPIFISLGNNQTLEWSNPAWVRKLSLACWLLAAAQLIALVPTFGAAALSWSSGFSGRAAAKLLYLAVGVYLLSFHAAMGILAWPEMRFPDKDRLLRIGLQIMAGAGCAAGLLYVYGGASGYLIGLPFLLPLGLLLSHALLWGYLRTLARRLPSRGLTRTASIVLGFFLVTAFLWLYLVGSALITTFLAPVVYGPASAVAFVIFALALQKAAQSAAENWAIEA